MFSLKATKEFSRWLERLKDHEARGRLLFKIEALRKTGHAGDFKAIGEGVYEGRFHFGPGYRIYYARRGAEVILLLMGGTKTTQRADIELAKKLNRSYE